METKILLIGAMIIIVILVIAVISVSCLFKRAVNLAEKIQKDYTKQVEVVEAYEKLQVCYKTEAGASDRLISALREELRLSKEYIKALNG